MDNLKRIGLYGVSGTGKTTILKEVSKLTSNVIWLEGSQLVINAAGLTLEQFKKLSDKEKYFFREKAIDKAFEIQRKESKHHTTGHF
jgi:adenylate kinase